MAARHIEPNLKKGRALAALPVLFYSLQNSVLPAFLVHFFM
jgi:hypothetical protein